MTIGGAISDLNNLLKADDIPIYYKPSIKKVIETIESLPPVTPKPMECEDVVSREAVLTLSKDIVIGDYRHRCIDPQSVMELPSITPTRPKGKCRKAHEMFEDRLHCSCGLEWVITRHWDKYNYCPNCGAKIEGEENERLYADRTHQ